MGQMVYDLNYSFAAGDGNRFILTEIDFGMPAADSDSDRKWMNCNDG